MRLSFLAPIGLLSALAAAACGDATGHLAGSEETSTSSAALSSHPTLAPAQKARATRAPTLIDQAGARSLLKKAKYDRSNKMSADSVADLKQNKLHSVPYFQGSYTLAGSTYGYSMVGGDPKRGGTTNIETSILPVSFVFDEFANADGSPVVLDATPGVTPVLTGPDFLRAPYGTGNTQFMDAIQRAEFWNGMGRDWHTLLEQPRALKPITIEVPVGASQVYTTAAGVTFTLMNIDFFYSQFNTIAQMADFRYDELAIMLTPGVLLYEGGDPNNCCVLGFHTAWDAQNPEGLVDSGPERFAQTFAWASWLDPSIYGSGFSDVTGLSHEISEWANDPFVDNVTEPWSFPGSGGAQCQSNLETGDPVEVTPTPAFPVTLHGYTYHPQTEALLQWFTRATPSTAIDGAYSYPDETALTGPSTDCSADAGALN